jgi:hypothetical protein
MDELEISLVLRYKVPKNGFRFNGVLRGLEKDKDILMRGVVKVILQVLEEKVIEEYKGKDPKRYLKHGRRTIGRKFLTSFGEISYRLAQMYDGKRGTIFCPLIRKLSILPYKQYQGESLEASVGQVIHLSYRLASKESQRIRGYAPSKSTLYRRVQELAEGYGQWPSSYKHRPFQFLMVDGTSVKLQGGRGKSLGKTEMRWAFASEGVGKRFEPVGFWVGEQWSAIRKDLERRLDYGRLQVLFSDGGPGIEENLLSCGMRQLEI